MPFSAGTVFLSVVPSFHGLQRSVEREVKTLGPALAKSIDAGMKDGAKSAEKSGNEAASKYSGAFAKKLRADLSKAANDISIKANVDSAGAERALAKLAIQLKEFSNLEIRADINGAEALAHARLLEKQLDAIVRDQTVDIDIRFNAAQARTALAGIATAAQRAIGPTAAEYAEAKRLDADYTRVRVEAAKQRASAEQDAANIEKNMAREVATFRQGQAQEAKRASSIDAGSAAIEKTMVREVSQFRKNQAQDVANEKLRIEALYARDSEELERTHQRALERLVVAKSVQTETGNRVGASEASSIAASRAVAERYAAEERAAEAAANVRIRAAARASVGETAAAEMAQQRVEESYKEEARAAAASSAARVALAKIASQQERAARSSADDSTGSQLAKNTGQAANSFRIFNGVLLAAVTIGPLLIPILAGIAAGLGAIAVASIGAIVGVGALVAGFGGIGTAVQALSGVAKERRKQSTGSGASANPEKDLRGLRDAQTALARARQDSGRQIASAAKQQEQAERSLTSAVIDAAKAQNDLVSARQAAARDLEDMNNRLASGLLSEQLGAFSLQEAGFKLNNVLEDTQASEREKAVARLQYAEAQQQYKELQTSNRRLEQDVAKANTAGVDGADAVVAAKQNIVDTNQAVIDGEAAVNDAKSGVARARLEEARTLADAEQRVGDAYVDLQTKSVAAGVDGSAAMDKLKESMLNLSPAGQRFAEFLFGLKPLLDAVRFAAQEGLLPGVQDGLKQIVDTYGPSFITFIGSIAQILGDLARQAAIALTGPFWQDFFSMMAKYAPIFLKQFASISGSLLTMIAGVLMAFAPFSAQIGDAFVAIAASMADWGKNLAGTQGFIDFLAFVKESGPKVFQMLLLILTIVLKLMVGLEPYSSMLLDITVSFLAFLAALDPKTLAIILGVFIAIVAAIQALAGVIAIVSSVAGLITGVGAAIATIAGAEGIAALGAVSVPILAIVAAVVAAVAAIILLAFWIKDLWQTNQTFRDVVTGVWDEVTKIIGIAWGGIQIYLAALKAFFDMFILPVLRLFQTVWTDIWNDAASVIGIAWSVIKAVFDIIYQVIKFILMPIFSALYNETIKPIWENGIRPIFSALGNFILDNVAPAFQAGVDAIKGIWESLRDIAKAPVRFVVDTVINSGIIDNFNKLVDIFPGMTKVARVKLPEGFATGGILPGYTPGRDVHRFVSPTGGMLDLSGGEAILRPELTQALGADWVSRGNKAARGGGIGGAQRFLGGYADGGILGWLGNAASSVSDAISGAIGTVGELLSDPGKALRGVVGSLLGDNNTGIASLAAGMALKTVDGVVNFIGGLTRGPSGAKATEANVPPNTGGGIGYKSMEAILSGAFPGIRFTSDFRPNAITAVGTRSYHGLGRAVDMAPSMDYFNWLSSNYPDSRELFFSPAGPARQIVNGGRNPNLAPITRAMHFNHVHWAYDQGGIIPKLYDGGGSLPPGLSLIANHTNKPEQVLTDSQWKQITQRRDGGGGVTFTGDVNGGEELARQIADKIETKKRDAAAIYQLDSIGVSL